MNLLKTRGDDRQKSADQFPNGSFHLHYQAIALYNQYLWPSRGAEAPLPQPALPWRADNYTLYIIYRWMERIYGQTGIADGWMDRIYRWMFRIYMGRWKYYMGGWREYIGRLATHHGWADGGYPLTHKAYIAILMA